MTEQEVFKYLLLEAVSEMVEQLDREAEGSDKK